MMQTLIVLGILAVAVGFALRRAWAAYRAARSAVKAGAPPCGPGCGCS